MTNKNIQQAVEGLQDLEEMALLSANILAAQAGDERSRELLAAHDDVMAEFPGSPEEAKETAEEHFVEPLRSVGIDARSEYVGRTRRSEDTVTGQDFHRVDIFIGSQEGEE